LTKDQAIRGMSNEIEVPPGVEERVWENVVGRSRAEGVVQKLTSLFIQPILL
jgi:hypothetical protein